MINTKRQPPLSAEVVYTAPTTLRVPQRIELLPEITEALTSYLMDRMNPQDSPYVFLTGMASNGPLQGNTVGSAVAKHIAAAYIDAGNRSAAATPCA